MHIADEHWTMPATPVYNLSQSMDRTWNWLPNPTLECVAPHKCIAHNFATKCKTLYSYITRQWSYSLQCQEQTRMLIVPEAMASGWCLKRIHRTSIIFQTQSFSVRALGIYLLQNKKRKQAHRNSFPTPAWSGKATVTLQRETKNRKVLLQAPGHWIQTRKVKRQVSSDDLEK